MLLRYKIYLIIVLKTLILYIIVFTLFWRLHKCYISKGINFSLAAYYAVSKTRSEKKLIQTTLESTLLRFINLEQKQLVQGCLLHFNSTTLWLDIGYRQMTGIKYKFRFKKISNGINVISLSVKKNSHIQCALNDNDNCLFLRLVWSKPQGPILEQIAWTMCLNVKR